MKYEEFVCCMQTKMQEKLGDEVRTELHQVTKNNDIVLDGLTFYQQGMPCWNQIRYDFM